jgi:predicted GNAT superfamily acetyltransferase
VDKVNIRPLRCFGDYEGCVEIQREVWGHADLDITPVHQFCISVQTGALLLGAFVGKKLAGYVYSFPAAFGRKNCQHSHHLAVLPDYQGYGIGKKLKQAQWKEALRAGYDLVTWTYDPMQARNANLNLHTLGVVGKTYLDDFYGRTPSLSLDIGVPTDRLLVEWWIKSARVRRKMSREDEPPAAGRFAAAVKGRAKGLPLAHGLYPRASTADGAPSAVDPRAKPGALTRDVNTRLSTAEADPQTKPGAPATAPAAVERKPGGTYPDIAPARPILTLKDPNILVELPKNIRDLKPVPGAIGRWQKAVRTALKHYFSHGYRLEDFIFGERCYYVLKKSRS